MTRVASSPSQYCRRSLPEMSALFPTLMKVEMPTWRCRARASMARPNAPLWDGIATLPRGGRVGRERGVEPDGRIGIEESHGVGPDDPHSVASGFFEEFLLEGAPLVVGLRESRGDDDERPDARDRAVVDGREHPVARDRHDRPDPSPAGAPARRDRPAMERRDGAFGFAA